MTFETVKEMTDAVKPAASVLSDRVRSPISSPPPGGTA